MISLGRRLETALSLADVHDLSIDVGTDHGYLAIELIRRGLAKRVIATDNKPLPLSRALENIAKASLNDAIACHLGDGLTWFEAAAGNVFILGMGGQMIASILASKGPGTIHSLILGPNSEAKELRQSLERLHFAIVDEAFITERGKYYPLLKCVEGEMHLSPAEMAYGPIILQKRPLEFLHFLGRKKAVLSEGLLRTNDETKRQTLRQEIAFLEDIIDERH